MINDINDLIRVKNNILLNLSDDPDTTVSDMIRKMSLVDLVSHIYSKDTTVCKFIETEIIRSYVHKKVTNDSINNESIKNIYRIHKRYYFVDPNITNWKTNKNLLYESTYDTDSNINFEDYVEVYNIDKDKDSRNAIYDIQANKIKEDIELDEITFNPLDHINFATQEPLFTTNENNNNYTIDPSDIVG